MLREFGGLQHIPVKTLLQDLARKDPFSCTPARSCRILQDPAGSCGILRDFACRNLAGILCKNPARFLQNPARSHKIPQDLARSCKILQGCKKKGPFLARSCKSVFTGMVIVNKAFRQFHSKWHCVKHNQYVKQESGGVSTRKFLKNMYSEITHCTNFDLLADKLNI